MKPSKRPPKVPPPPEPAFDPAPLSEAEKAQAFRNGLLILKALQEAGVPMGPLPTNRMPI